MKSKFIESNPFLAKFAIVFASVAALTSSSSSIAGLIVEPYAGYEVLGSLELNNTNWGSYNGLGFGLRGMYQFLDLVFAGADFSYFPSINFSTTSAAAVGTSGTTNARLGIVAGVDVPILPIRAWLGYNFLDRLNSTYAGNNNGLSGNSFKIGAGFKFIPLVSLNAEYIITTYGSLDIAGTSSDSALGGNNVTGKTVFFSLSVPLPVPM